MPHAGMVTEINGLPAHILLIHLVVIGIPVAALLTVLSAVWPAARRRLGIITPIVAGLALITVPITTHAGEWLQARVFHGFSNPLIVRHAHLGGELLPWAIGLFVWPCAAWGVPVMAARSERFGARTRPASRSWSGARGGLAVVAVVQVYRIGDAGAKAAWSSNFCAAALRRRHLPDVLSVSSSLRSAAITQGRSRTLPVVRRAGKVLVGPGRVGQRVGRADGYPQPAVGHPPEQVRRPAQQLRPGDR